jgi:hypothetical protein
VGTRPGRGMTDTYRWAIEPQRRPSEVAVIKRTPALRPSSSSVRLLPRPGNFLVYLVSASDRRGLATSSRS